MSDTVHTLVVGAGGAGAPLAARLSADPRRRVTLVEAGTPHQQHDHELRDAMSLASAVPGHPANWSFPAELTPSRSTIIARGRTFGGSTGINGGYFVAPTTADIEHWGAVAGAAWSRDALARTLTSVDAAMPATIPPQDAPASAALHRAAAELGLSAEAVPSNFHSSERISSADAYLPFATERLEVRGNTRVLRIVCSGTRVVGLDTDQGFIEADEVVLCAGAILSPQLLLLSGVGPRADLETLGIPVVADLPVGAAFADHPNLALSWRVHPGVIDEGAAYPFPTAVRLQAADRDPALAPRVSEDLEFLLAAHPLGRLLTGDPNCDTLQVMVALQEHAGRGRLSLRSADPHDPPRIEYRYLEQADDRRRFRVAVRTAVALLQAPTAAAVFAGSVDLTAATLADDDALDAWIDDHLGTALHTCATAPMGTVTDGAGRVRGVAGLRIADTSILPSAPHRGPAKSAVMVGEHIAWLMRAGE